MTIFTDGSCAPNPGPGGFGVVVYNEDDIIIDCYAHQEEITTNNRMELKAIIYATIKHGVKITNEDVFVNNIPVVYSDSYYCVQALTKWMFTWAQNEWKTSRNELIENLDLIKMYYDLYQKGYRIDLRKIKGHEGIEGNEVADQLATGRKKVKDILKYEKILLDRKEKEKEKING